MNEASIKVLCRPNAGTKALDMAIPDAVNLPEMDDGLNRDSGPPAFESFKLPVGLTWISYMHRSILCYSYAAFVFQ
jgi:hypothetical protein